MHLKKIYQKLLVTAAALLAISEAGEMLTELIPIPLHYFHYSSVAGVLLLISGFLLYSLSFLPKPTETLYISRPVKLQELDSVYQLIVKILGDDIAPKSLVKEWLEKNPHVLYAVEKQSRNNLKNTSSIEGFFSVFPITAETKRLLERDEIQGTMFSSTSFISNKRHPSAIYIGAVGASTMRSKGATLQMLIGNVTGTLGIKGGKVIMRPTTPDSIRLANQYKFQKCTNKELSNNYYLDIPPS